MATGFFNWSQTPSVNASATYTWAEGMAPSSVNDSARGIMSDAAKWRDDISGAITTGGSSTAYTVTSYSTFTSLALMNGQMIAFTPHTTCGATVTLNVDSLGAKPLRSAPSTELVSGHLVQGTPYVAVYNSSDQAFYLHSFFGNPYSVPIGVSVDFWGSTAPNSAFVLMYGQAISRTTYSTLFSMFSTTYGSGDGSTTFNIPDLRGRATAGKHDMGGSEPTPARLTSTSITTGGPTTLGGTGGADTKALATTNLPAYTPSGTVTVSAVALATRSFNLGGGTSDVNTVSQGNSAGSLLSPNGLPFASATAAFSGSAQGGNATAFSLAQPTIICNKLLRII